MRKIKYIATLGATAVAMLVATPAAHAANTYCSDILAENFTLGPGSTADIYVTSGSHAVTGVVWNNDANAGTNAPGFIATVDQDPGGFIRVLVFNAAPVTAGGPGWIVLTYEC
jgi:hypothetical protein